MTAMTLVDVFTFLGRLHPSIVHLPIGFLLLATIFELASYSKKYHHLRSAVPFTTLLGFVTAVVACVFGFMLSSTGDYDAKTLSYHKAAGILIAVMSGILWGMRKISMVKVPGMVFTSGSIVTLLLLVYAGHQGGKLTHGNDYLAFETLFDEERPRPARAQEALIFEDIVHPILEQRCMGCHNEGKRKGRLSMATLKSIFTGGKHGPAVVPGDLSDSELYRRVTLDPSHENFMPADGKPPLTESEVEIIRWWIETARSTEGKMISEIEHSEKIIPLVAAWLRPGGELPVDVSSLTAYQEIAVVTDTADISAVNDLRRNGFTVRVMQRAPMALDVTLPPRSAQTIEDIERGLEGAAPHIVWLNLSDNGFNEKDLTIIEKMVNLHMLRLEKNPLSDGIADHLDSLRFLRVLNLNETQLTMAGLRRLQQNTSLKRIYTWKTRCDSIHYFKED